MNIQEALKLSKSNTFFHRGSIKAAQEMLLPNEEVLFAMTGNLSIAPVMENLSVNTFSTKDKVTGVLTVTTSRIIFCNSVVGAATSKQINIFNIQSVDDKSNKFGLSTLRISGLTEMFVVDTNAQNAKMIKNAIAEATQNHL